MDLVFRAIVLFFGVFVLLRVIDRRELAEMEPFDFILLIVLGDAIQQGLTQDDYSVTGALITVGTIAGLQTLVGWTAFRFKRARRVLEGEPVVLIENGNLIDRNLRRSHIGLEDLAEEARMSQLSSLDQIEWAVLETSGKVSIIPKKG
jgi:uncharacterized membrane protein YcaP (DUF421 family)